MENIHIYRDDHSGGWVVEVCAVGGSWYTMGVYGTRAAAVAAASEIPTCDDCGCKPRAGQIWRETALLRLCPGCVALRNAEVSCRPTGRLRELQRRRQLRAGTDED